MAKADDGSELALKCFKKATKDNYEMIKKFMDSQDEDCHFKISENKDSASYECNYSKSQIINCNTKLPSIGILSVPKIDQNKQKNIKECFEKVGVDLLQIKGSHSFATSSNSERTVIYICDEHVSEVENCHEKPKLSALEVDIKKYTGYLPPNKFSAGDFNTAKKCAEFLNIPLDLTPYPNLCGTQVINIEEESKSNTPNKAPGDVKSGKYGYADYMENRYLRPGSLESIYQKKFGDSSAYVIAKASNEGAAGASASAVGGMIDFIKDKLYPTTISFLISCPNSKQVFIPKCDLAKIEKNLIKTNSEAIVDTARVEKPSNNISSQNKSNESLGAGK